MNFNQLKQSRTKLYDKTFNSFLKKIPKKSIQPTGRLIYNLNEKVDSKYNIQSIEECCSITQVSLYSIVNGIKVGDPICDKIIIKFFENAAVMIIADGCGWGMSSFKAASSACHTIDFKIFCHDKIRLS